MNVSMNPGGRLRRHAARVAAYALAVAGLAGGAALPGTPPASAATPQCGQACVDLFSAVSATSNQPGLVIDALDEGLAIGTPVVLLGTSDTNVGEDFISVDQGLVSEYFAAGLITSEVNMYYGGGGPGSPDDAAFQLEYAPGGIYTGLCVGVASTAAQGEGVTLQVCGASSTTVWIVDSSASISGSFVPLINGSDTNFATPYVLTYPMSPAVPLETTTLQSSAGQVPDNQLWSEVFGVLTPPSAPPCPAGTSVHIRWHYSANGSAGGWSGTTAFTCPAGVSMGPQAMEGNMQVASGATLQAGYDFTIPGDNNSVYVTFTSPEVTFTNVTCANGATPGISTITVPMPDQSYNSTSGGDWYPSGDQSSSLVYQGSITVPDLCNGGDVDLANGGTFTATIS